MYDKRTQHPTKTVKDPQVDRWLSSTWTVRNPSPLRCVALSSLDARKSPLPSSYMSKDGAISEEEEKSPPS